MHDHLESEINSRFTELQSTAAKGMPIVPATLRVATTAASVKELQSISWILAEFCYNRSPQGPYTGTCTILQETINGFLCPLIVFRKM